MTVRLTTWLGYIGAKTLQKTLRLNGTQLETHLVITANKTSYVTVFIYIDRPAVLHAITVVGEATG